MKYEKEAEQIIQHVGGKENVIDLVHCATRLRFTLKNNTKADKELLSAMPDVLSVVVSGGQYQVVIGNKVSDYYAAIITKLGLKTGEKKEKQEKSSIPETIFSVISGAFSPIIPAMAGAGMIKALLTVLTSLGWLSDASTTYAIVSAAGNSVFCFLPIFLGITLAIKMNANPYVGGAIGAALLDPNFTALIGGEGVNFMGLSVVPIDYHATVFPIFVAMAIYAVLHKGLMKVVWKDVQLFLVPMISLLVMVPLTVILFGPIGTTIGDIVSNGIMWLIARNKLLAGAVLGGGMPFMVVFGLHWGFTPITLQNLAVIGGDPIEGAAVAAVFAEIGIAIGLFLRAKKHGKGRALAGPAALTGLLAGVTEPIVYGIILRYKRLIPIVAISGGIGGAICGALGVTCNAYVFHNVFSMPVYTPFYGYLLGIGIALILGVVLTFFFGFTEEDLKEEDGKEEKKEDTEISVEEIAAPLLGKMAPQNEIKDEVFASGAMGVGIAIEPEIGEVYAPVDGVVTTVFPTKHAIGVKSHKGVEILIHIGIDTVALDGKYFDVKIKEGTAIKKGELLVAFQKDKIEAEGYSTVTPVVVVNTSDFLDVVVEDQKEVTKATTIMNVIHR